MIRSCRILGSKEIAKNKEIIRSEQMSNERKEEIGKKKKGVRRSEIYENKETKRRNFQV